MWVRATRIRVAADRVEDLIAYFRDEIAPAAKQITGNSGAILLVDRGTGRSVSLTYWDNAAALQASESAASGLRSQAAAALGFTVDQIDRLELAFVERTSPPTAGRYVRVSDFSGDPAKIDAGIAYVRDKVFPAAAQLQGFRGMISAVDRRAGRTVSSTIWQTLDDLKASEAAIAPLREEGVRVLGATSATVEIYEGAFVDLTQAAVATG